MSNSRDLTSGPVALKLLKLAGPMVFGIIAVISVSLVDTYFVGKLGTDPLAALSFTFPVTLAVTSLAIGLSAGAASVVSRVIGADQPEEAKRLSTDSVILSIIVVIIISLIGFFTIRPLFSLLGASGDVLDMITRYMQIWYLSMPFLVIPMVANAIVRSVGDAFWPSLMMVASAIINIASTPVLIFGWGPIPALDIEGAAWGTLIARVFTLFGAVWLLVFREKMTTTHLPSFQKLMKSWRKVLAVGLPAAFGNAVNPIGITVVTGIIATYGNDVVAGFGVATRIESLSVIPMLALSSAIGPISGQNWGRGLTGRISLALKLSYATCFCWAMVLGLFFWFAAEPLARQFSNEEAVVNAAVTYLKIVPLSAWGYGCIIIAAGGFNALGKPLTGLGYYLSRTALLYIPLSAIAAMFLAPWGVFAGIAVANALSGTLAAIYSIWWLEHKSGPGSTSAKPQIA